MNNLSKQKVNIAEKIFSLVSKVLIYECWNLKQMGRVESDVDYI